MLTTVLPTQIDVAVGRLAGWLDTMRGPGGYGGPVAHWWQQSLIYTGPALDWRYEGIMAGYLTLWRRTSGQHWLAKARRAGDDILAGQLENGHYQASAFEINPATAGTPHEAACDVGLLLLAQALREIGDAGWERYAGCAERNIRAFYVGQLWDVDVRSFRDSRNVPSFVPNKAATACDALFLLAELRGDDSWIERYALPTLDRVVAHQVRRAGRIDGAIAQNSFGSRVVEKYFPIYIARCVPALLCGYRWSGQERYLDAALRAMRFVMRWAGDDGSLPTVVYPNLRISRHPGWVAPLADVLRAADELRPYGFDQDMSAIQCRLLAGQDSSGGIQTATGFAAQTGGSPGELPDVRDLLHVAGWCDKAFRYLAAHTLGIRDAEQPARFEAACTFGRKVMTFVETTDLVEVSERQDVRYRWRKGQPWAEVASEEFWLR